MPAEKNVEQRRQTQHKLELMRRYWGAWCAILARARTYPFCPTHLFLIDTHGGPGSHEADLDPDGETEGTPVLATLAALATQRAFQDVVVHVRATERDAVTAARLEAAVRRFRGHPPRRVDVTVDPVDWTSRVAAIAAELELEDHPHGGRPTGDRAHDHRSLWFIDPFGIEGLDHGVIESLPAGSEVVVNLDVMGTMRHMGKARSGIESSLRHLRVAFGGDSWDVAGGQREVAEAYAATFSATRWPHRDAYFLQATGSQDRAMVHLTRSQSAVTAFAKCLDEARRAGTVAGTGMTSAQRDSAAVRLFLAFRGLELTTRQIAAGQSRYRLDQIAPICRAAQVSGYGRFDEASRTMTWFEERAENGLFD